jgi:secondary thiamine-phosphate synthase enzyme
MIANKHIELKTKGNDDVIDVTGAVQTAVKESKVKNGIVTVFITGSTASVTTVEYEPGLVKDLKKLGERLAPKKDIYAHDETWHDHNGHSHVRASTIGPSLTVPIVEKSLTLGTWQQIVVIDHDIHPRQRGILIQVMGE